MPLVSAVAREIARVQLSQAAAATAAAAGGGAGSAEAAELLAAADGLQWEPRLVVFPHPQVKIDSDWLCGEGFMVLCVCGQIKGCTCGCAQRLYHCCVV